MKIGMIFPGYSSQFVGMGKEVYDDFRIVQEYFEEAYNCLNLNFIKLCFASSDAELSKASNAYLSIFLVSSSLAELLKENGIKPDVTAGYGIGHYAAMFTAGALTFPDGLYLLKKLATFFEENIQNLEVSVLRIEGLSSSQLNKLIKDFNNIYISIYYQNSKNFVSGKKSDIELLKEKLIEQKVKFYKVDSEIGLYSELMNDIANQFKMYLEKVDFKESAVPVINNDGKELTNGRQFRNSVINQISSSIKWNKVVEQFNEVDLIIEVGPGSLLSETIKQKYPEKKVISFNKKSDLNDIKKMMGNSDMQEAIKL